MEISRLWVAMLTRNEEHDGTDDLITLSINTASGEVLPPHSFPETKQRDRRTGQANLYELDVTGRNIVPEEITNSSIRVGILGGNAWSPEHFMVWGERVSVLGRTIIPLAIETGITEKLSTQESDDGVSDFPLRRVERGDRNLQINRLFILLTTAGVADPLRATDSPLEIQIVSEGHLVVLSEIRDTTQDDLEIGGANFYSAPVIAPFRKRDLDNSSITLRIKGLDDWEPESFFVFGLDDASGRPEFLVPLVHLPQWPHGYMEADSTTGVASLNLQLAPEELFALDGDFVMALNSIDSGQERIIGLLQKLVGLTAN